MRVVLVEFHVQFRLHLISLSVQCDRIDVGSHLLNTKPSASIWMQSEYIVGLCCIWWRVMHITHTHTCPSSSFYSPLGCVSVAGVAVCMRTRMTCACAMDICCIYTVCFIVTFSICAKTMCRWPLFTDLHHATHKNNIIPCRLLRRSGVCANRISNTRYPIYVCAMQVLYLLFFYSLLFSWIFIFCLFDWEPTLSHMFGALRLICK